MGRRRLIVVLQHLGLTREQAERALATVLSGIHQALASQQPVVIREFGSFLFKRNRRRKMWDPETREMRMVQGGMLLRFRPAAKLLNALHGANLRSHLDCPPGTVGRRQAIR